MPGNDSGDRVHNFFPQDNLSQGQQRIVDGNWSVVNNNLYVGSPGQIGVPSPSTKNYNLQQSDTDRGQSSHALHGPHGLNFTQSRSDYAKNLSQSQQSNSNGYVYGNRVNQTRQDEANFLAVDSVSDHHNLVSRGLSMYESHQGTGSQHQLKSVMRSGTSESPVSFDFFGNQQQMHHAQSSMLQSLQRQQSGFSDMQQLQQQMMFIKMQELQRQQQLRQLDARHQNPINSLPTFAKQSSGNYPSTLVNGSPSSDLPNNPWGSEPGNMNWLQRASPVMQGSSNGFVYSPNHGQTHRTPDLVPQQGDQSLYGVPVSDSRSNVTHFSHMAVEKPSMQSMSAFANTLPGNQQAAFAEQASMQDESIISRQRFPGANPFMHPSSQSHLQVNPVQRIASPQEIYQEVAGSQEKTLPQVATSPNEVSLDPTEERILFGSDDNIWAAFGKGPSASGDVGGPFDNLQSGTWSALMQSAVAETSSSDMGQQEGWGGLNLQNTTVHSGNQHLTYSEKQQTSFHNGMPSSLNSSVLTSNNSSMNTSYQHVMGVQLGNKLACEPDRRLLGSSSQREGSNMSNPGALQSLVSELRPIHGNMLGSLDAETHVKSVSSPWAPAQSGLRQQYSKSSGWNVLEPVAPTADAPVTMLERESSSQHSQGYEQKTVMQKEAAHGGFLWNSCSKPSSTVEVDRANSSMGNLSVTRDGFTMASTAASLNSNPTRFSEETDQHLSNQGNNWKNVNPMVRSHDRESVERSHHHSNLEYQALDSSFNSSDKAEVKVSEMETYKQKDNSSDSYRSNMSHNNVAGGIRDSVLSDGSDSRSLPSGKQKSTNQIGRKNSGAPKFQYHPMGNLDEDVEPQYGMKHSSHSLAMSQQSTDFRQVKSLSQIPRSSVELAKGQSADQKDVNNIKATPSYGNFPGHIHTATSPVNQVDMSTPARGAPSSQNMLELLHKVDQSRDHGLAMHSSPGHNLSSETPEAEHSGSFVSRLQRGQSSTSQGFGLQLGPPTHRTAVPNQSFISQSSQQMINNSHQSQAAPETGEKVQSQLPSSPSVQSLPPLNERTLGEFKSDRHGLPGQAINNAFMHKMPGNFSSAVNAGFPHSRSQFQYQQMVRASGQVSTNQHDASCSVRKDDIVGGPSTGQTAQATSLNAARNVQHANSDSLGVQSQQNTQLRGSEPVSVSQPLSLCSNSQQGALRKMLPNMWSNVPGQPHLLNPPIQKISSNVLQLHQPSVLESNSFAPNKQVDQDSATGRNSPSVSGASSMNKESPALQDSARNVNVVQKDELQGAESVPNNLAGSPANSASVQKDLEAFGRSLKSNNLSHQNYSLLNQMRAMKSAEPDSNNRALKKMKGPESIVECQQLTPKAAQSSENAVGHHSSVPSEDQNIHNFSGLADNAERKASAQFGNVSSRNLPGFSQEGSWTSLDGNNLASVRVDNPQISPQMAPSWFNQYGTFRNGQMLTMHDARVLKTAEQPFTLGKSFSGLHPLNSMEQVTAVAVDPGQIGNVQSVQPSSIATSVAIEPQSLPHNVPRPKKRKRTTFHLTSWREEVSQGSQSPLTISIAEVRWARAANRLTDKIDDEVDLSEDGPPVLRLKRRLILTTQLMQQLLSPPKSAILCSDAESNYESVVYSVSRSALGDACGLVSHRSSYSDRSYDGVNLSSGNFKKSEKVDDRHLFKVMEDFTGRARKLENNFLRLDKRASMVDLRVECQELEKFSVINRFAKFHGRGQVETVDTSSSDALRPYPQRYVTALPVPRYLPDRVQCLSL